MQRHTEARTSLERPTEGGFTLVEALVAIVVLIFGLMAVTNLMLVAASSNSVSNQATAAAAIASERLEQLKAIPFTALTTGTFNRTDAIPGVGTITTTWTVTSVDPQAYFITVTSEGTGALSRARSRAQFTAVRSCTSTLLGCPAAP